MAACLARRAVHPPPGGAGCWPRMGRAVSVAWQLARSADTRPRLRARSCSADRRTVPGRCGAFRAGTPRRKRRARRMQRRLPTARAVRRAASGRRRGTWASTGWACVARARTVRGGRLSAPSLRAARSPYSARCSETGRRGARSSSDSPGAVVEPGDVAPKRSALCAMQGCYRAASALRNPGGRARVRAQGGGALDRQVPRNSPGGSGDGGTSGAGPCRVVSGGCGVRRRAVRGPDERIEGAQPERGGPEHGLM